MNKLYSEIGAALDALLCGFGDTRGRLVWSTIVNPLLCGFRDTRGRFVGALPSTILVRAPRGAIKPGDLLPAIPPKSAYAMTADKRGRLAITLETDGVRENDMVEIVSLTPHEEGMRGAYRRADIWYVDRGRVYDGTVFDGAGNLQLVEASEASCQRLLAALTGAVRIEMREAA